MSISIPSIRIHQLAKQYYEGDHTRILFTNLELTISSNEIIALIGRSGSGKSTLLNLISGIDIPEHGQIWVNNQEITLLNETARTQWRRRHLGFIFQSFNLIPTLTVAENILLPLELNRLATSTNKKQAIQWLSKIGLGDRQNNFPENLSGGEQQRVAIIRALVHKPEILLADEPTGNLDNNTGAEVLTLMLTLARELGTTVVIATHSDAVMASADRVLHLENGQLQASNLE